MKHRLRYSTLRLPRRSVSNARLTTLDEVERKPALVKALTDRISSLPGMVRRDEIPGDSLRVDFHITNEYLRDSTVTDSRPLAAVYLDGRMILRLPQTELEQVLGSGWGEMHGDRICTFAPRDTGDLTILRRIFLTAYFDLVERRSSSVWRIRPQRSRSRLPGDSALSSNMTPSAFF